MKDDPLEQLFARARGAQAIPIEPLPDGFADRVTALYQNERRRQRTALRASVLSLSVALTIFATIVGLNFNAITSVDADDQDPVDDVAQVLWDSAGN
jgi:hypothetical protein